MNELLRKFQELGIVPVVVLDNAKDAEPLAKALCEGGLPCAEVTFRTDAAEESIRIMAQKFPNMLVGAGTVLTIDQVDRAVAAGAKFIVSPGLNPKVVKYCVEKNIPITPGVQTPSEIEQALEFGLDVLKFIPTGGISTKNAPEYLAYDKILAVGGSWVASKDLINAGKFDEIAKITKESVAMVKAARAK